MYCQSRRKFVGHAAAPMGAEIKPELFRNGNAMVETVARS
jgi:hypothetical protein